MLIIPYIIEQCIYDCMYVYIHIYVVSNVYKYSTQCPGVDKVALCCMLALCRVFEPRTQQSCLSFPAECQSPGPLLLWGGQNAQPFTQSEGKYVVTKLEHKLYSFSWNLLNKINK